MATRTCPRCGERNLHGSRSCAVCGHDLLLWHDNTTGGKTAEMSPQSRTSTLRVAGAQLWQWGEDHPFEVGLLLLADALVFGVTRVTWTNGLSPSALMLHILVPIVAGLVLGSTGVRSALAVALVGAMSAWIDWALEIGWWLSHESGAPVAVHVVILEGATLAFVLGLAGAILALFGNRVSASLLRRG